MKKFAFLIHLRTIDDLTIAFPWLPKFMVPVLRPSVLRHFENLKGNAGFMLRSNFEVRNDAEGSVLLMLLTGEQMASTKRAHKNRERILETALYAQNELKCDIVGLGSLTASVTDAGQWLTKQKELTIPITHGDHYTVAVASEGVKRVAQKTRLNLAEAKVAILGATGIIGKGLTRQLAPLVKNLILVGRNAKKLEELRSKTETLGSKPLTTTNVQDVDQADMIITATSWPEALIRPIHLKKNAVIYEVSQPRNVSRSILKKRPDVLVVDGAYVSIPGDIQFWWMGRPPHTSFACLVETIMQAMEGDLQSHVGDVDSDFVEEVRRRAKKHGFGHASFTSFNKIITEERFQTIGEKIRKSR